MLETKKGKVGKSGKTVDKGWACDLVPKALLVQHHLAAEQLALDKLTVELDGRNAALMELEEEDSGDDSVLGGFDKINDKEVSQALTARVKLLADRYGQTPAAQVPDLQRRVARVFQILRRALPGVSPVVHPNYCLLLVIG